jgi:hypothetical protein
MTKKTSTSSRAEKIREKRQTGKVTTTRKRGQKQSRSLSDSAPVMVRSTRSANAAKRSRSKNKRAKRRYDISLPTPGVEMRLPSLPSVNLGWRALSFCMLVGLSFSLYYLWTSPQFLVQEVHVDGIIQYAPDNISQRLLVYQKPIFTIDPETIERQLLKQVAGVVAVSFQVGFPAQVAVLVEERVPVILWEQDGEALWIDAQGIAFEPPGLALGLVEVQASASPPAPFITDDEVSDELEAGIEADQKPDFELLDAPKVFMTPEMVAAIRSLGEQIPEGVDLLYDGQHGFGWRDPDGWDVYFGFSDDDIEMKLKVYSSVEKKLRAEGIQPALISVEFLHAPFYLER